MLLAGAGWWTSPSGTEASLAASREGGLHPHSCPADTREVCGVSAHVHTRWARRARAERSRGCSSPRRPDSEPRAEASPPGGKVSWGSGAWRVPPPQRSPCAFPLGFVYRPFEECLDFICQNEDNRMLRFHSGLLLGLYSGVAVW